MSVMSTYCPDCRHLRSTHSLAGCHQCSCLLRGEPKEVTGGAPRTKGARVNRVRVEVELEDREGNIETHIAEGEFYHRGRDHVAITPHFGPNGLVDRVEVVVEATLQPYGSLPLHRVEEGPLGPDKPKPVVLQLTERVDP